MNRHTVHKLLGHVHFFTEPATGLAALACVVVFVISPERQAAAVIVLAVSAVTNLATDWAEHLTAPKDAESTADQQVRDIKTIDDAAESGAGKAGK